MSRKCTRHSTNSALTSAAGDDPVSVPVRRALVFLFALNILLAGANVLWTAHVVNVASQARCASVEADATIPLPRPGASSPARDWESAFEADARARARQLGCGQ